MIKSGNNKILIIAPHADDECLGCGGLMKKAIDYGNEVKVVIGATGDTFFYHANKIVTAKEREHELVEALKVFGVNEYEILYTDKEGVLDTVPMKDIVTKLDSIISDYQPNMVFIPYPSFHNDHKIMFEASFASLRPSPATKSVKFVATFEYPFVSWNYEKIEGGSMYLDISDCIDLKISALKKHRSQIREGRHMISPETVKLWAEKRGLECSRDYAEMYRVIRYVLTDDNSNRFYENTFF